MENNDELMEDLSIPEIPVIHEAFFQFDDDAPIKIAFVAGGEFSFTLKADSVEEPSIEFADGNGKVFRIMLKKAEDGV